MWCGVGCTGERAQVFHLLGPYVVLEGLELLRGDELLPLRRLHRPYVGFPRVGSVHWTDPDWDSGVPDGNPFILPTVHSYRSGSGHRTTGQSLTCAAPWKGRCHYPVSQPQFPVHGYRSGSRHRTTGQSLTCAAPWKGRCHCPVSQPQFPVQGYRSGSRHRTTGQSLTCAAPWKGRCHCPVSQPLFTVTVAAHDTVLQGSPLLVLLHGKAGAIAPLVSHCSQLP
ncbi:hypothetical protein LAZ67_3003556 [Cordylochernes scorpioides]|uniref:Uncharacterized protein n=1 Tax=Cordylochernes scorpioides TaxID=51811 RepID=A0ABY6K9E6_9ARAC|nr:hypothetical protein LAZ67_3003556 [Cordylochernes scorpioides]